MKECDRLAVVAQIIIKLGGQVEEHESSLIVKGQKSLAGGCLLNAWNDHRIAMMLAVLGLRCEKEITIEGYECVNKSYPIFFEEFKRLKNFMG